MRAGRLREHIIINKISDMPSLSGAITKTVSESLPRMAAAVPTTGREYWAAQAVQGETTVMFTIRYDLSTSGVTQKDEIVWQEDVYDIRSVILAWRKDRIEILAVKRE